MGKSSLFGLFFFLIFSCSVEPDEEPQMIFEKPQIFVSDSRVFELEGGSKMRFEVGTPNPVELPVSFNFIVEGKTATPDVDFVAVTGSSIIGVGSRVVVVEVDIIDDKIHEVDEELTLTLTNVENATITKERGVGVIQDTDPLVNYDEEGYFTSESYYGFESVWKDEFTSAVLNPDDYNFELGDGCPNLCGWGNQELQWYTSEKRNIDIQDGRLVFTATKDGSFSFNSARIHTKGKREFQFGRIDIRAKLPYGQGIWPAIWMLGSNIDQVGWPASGEIDIMEMVGHVPNRIHGTAHWGPVGGPGTNKGSHFSLTGEEYKDAFHVFSIIWTLNKIEWYVDETKFFTLTPQDMNGASYRFNQKFFLVFNVAVGGQWPGNPNETTVFPQQMVIDYIRVFQ